VPQTDIFSALSKYDGSISPENYLTEALAFLLRHLLAEEPAAAVAILNDLCGANDAFSFKDEESRELTVETQVTTEQGRPDLMIAVGDKRACLEVKKEAALGGTQLERYGDALEASSAAHTRLVVLSRYHVDIPARGRQPDHCVRWFQVHEWLTGLTLTNPASCYLRDQFTAFLEASHMSIARVGWELMSGVEALANFGQMLAAAVEQAGLQGEAGKITFTGEYCGCYFGSHNALWCGIYYKRPILFYFSVQSRYPASAKALLLAKARVRYNKDDDGFYLDLESESTHFFALGKDAQLGCLAKFIRTCYDLATQARGSAKKRKKVP